MSSPNLLASNPPANNPPPDPSAWAIAARERARERRRPLPDFAINNFLRRTEFPSLEAYLEDKINQGIHPEKAVTNLYRLFDPDRGNFLSSNREFNPDYFAVKLELSKAFVNRWLKYPSGRKIGKFEYLQGINIPSLVFENIRYLTPLPQQLGNPGFLVDQPNNDITPLPCVLFDNQPLYIPVLRYALKNPATYKEEKYCGTYYYFDEGPQLYLRSTKTLIAPDPAHAYFYLSGGDANAAQLVLENRAMDMRDDDTYTRSIFDGPVSPPTPHAFELAERFQSHRLHCEPEEFQREGYDPKGAFEQILCRLGRHLGYDVIISSHPSEISRHMPAGRAQMFDTRSREESFANLVWRIP